MTASKLKDLYVEATKARVAFYRERGDGPWSQEDMVKYRDLSDLAEAAFLEWRAAITDRR